MCIRDSSSAEPGVEGQALFAESRARAHPLELAIAARRVHPARQPPGVGIGAGVGEADRLQHPLLGAALDLLQHRLLAALGQQLLPDPAERVLGLACLDLLARAVGEPCLLYTSP